MMFDYMLLDVYFVEVHHKQSAVIIYVSLHQPVQSAGK